MSNIIDISKKPEMNGINKIDKKIEELNKELSEWLMNNVKSESPFPTEMVERAWIRSKFAEIHVLIELMDESITNIIKAISNLQKGFSKK